MPRSSSSSTTGRAWKEPSARISVASRTLAELGRALRSFFMMSLSDRVWSRTVDVMRLSVSNW